MSLVGKRVGEDQDSSLGNPLKLTICIYIFCGAGNQTRILHILGSSSHLELY